MSDNLITNEISVNTTIVLSESGILFLLFLLALFVSIEPCQASSAQFYSYHNTQVDESSAFSQPLVDNSYKAGEDPFRTNAEYVSNAYSTRATIAAIQDFSGDELTYKGREERLECFWTEGKAKGLFQESLGSFDDPMKLFSDFKTEHNKVGGGIEQSIGNYTIKSLYFTAEGDTDSQEQGIATRMTYGADRNLRLGTSYTLRSAVSELDEDSHETEQALGLDVALPLLDSFSLLAQATATEGSRTRADAGYQLQAAYDLGQFRFAGGYINLGENFNAPFADPLRGVESDAQGIETSIDYKQVRPFLMIRNMAASLRYFSLSRNSDDEKIQEVDGALRFGLGEHDTIFLSFTNSMDESDSNLATSTSYNHKWNKKYSSGLQFDYSENDSDRTLQASISTSRQEGERSARIALEWLGREEDNSESAPTLETNLRIDLKERLWALQLEGKYSEDSEGTGYNLFGKVEYKPIHLDRYNVLTYLSVGSESAMEFEERIEVGLEFTF